MCFQVNKNYLRVVTHGQWHSANVYVRVLVHGRYKRMMQSTDSAGRTVLIRMVVMTGAGGCFAGQEVGHFSFVSAKVRNIIVYVIYFKCR